MRQLILDFTKSDIGTFKASVAKREIKGIKKCICDFLNEDNIIEILDTIRPDYIFCCADDSSLRLHNLLLDNIEKFGYNLLVAGYSYKNVFVDCITPQNFKTFKGLYKVASAPEKDKVIFHNTGTLSDGYLSASFMMTAFIKSFDNIDFNHYVFDKEMFSAEIVTLRKLNNSEQFNLLYDNYIAFLKDSTHAVERKAMRLFRNTDEQDINSDINKKINKFNELIFTYNKNKGDFTEQYRISKSDSTAYEQILERIKRDANTMFADKYIELINLRKNTVTRNIKSKLERLYGRDFLSEIISYFEINKIEMNVNSLNMLELSIRTVEKEVITFSQAITKLLITSDSSDFSSHIVNMLSRGQIDYAVRPKKTCKNMTVYNPIRKESNVIINYAENSTGFSSLVHELMHAFVFELFKEKLDLDNFRLIKKDFWEILAKTGEMFILSNFNKDNDFMYLSSYNLGFCILDYMLAKKDGNIEYFNDIVSLRQKVDSLFGIDKKAMHYMEYNFILYPMLYSTDLSVYNLVYQDIIAYALYVHMAKEKITFASFYSDISQMNELNVDALLRKYKLDFSEVMQDYLMKISKCLISCFDKNYLSKRRF